jgi:pimeloyl-ACP methyl ester carboxylesterase
MNHPPSVFAVDPKTVFDFVPFTNAPEGVIDLYVKSSVFKDAFAASGVGRRDVRRLTASQRPLSTAAFVQPSGAPAWATTRSWAVVGLEDRIIPAADQLAWAERAGASITKLRAPHVSMLTDPQRITEVIVSAARST